MSTSRRTLLVALILAMGLGSVASAGWLHISSSILKAEKEIQKHPAALDQVIDVFQELDGGSRLCVSYANNFKKKSAGRVLTRATILEPDGSERSFRFVGGVKKNFYLNCKRVRGAIAEDSMILFSHRFKGYPRLRSNAAGTDFIEVNAVLSTTGEPVAGQEAPFALVPASGTAPLGILPGEEVGWSHAAKSVFQAEGDNQKHPTKLEQAVLVPGEVGGAMLCATYNRLDDDDNDGRVIASATITKPDGSVESRKLVGGVKDNDFLVCKDFESTLPAGTLVDVVFELNGMPRLDVADGLTGFADLHTVITNSGEPAFREPPPPPPPPKEPPPPAPTTPAPTPTGPSTPPPPAPSGGGGITAADEAAVVRMFNLKSVQLQRPNQSSPAKIMVVGPKSELLPGSGHKIDPATAGVSNSSIAAAVADYERKHRTPFPPGGTLDAETKALLAWYVSMSSANGPTSVRHDAQGRFHGEYYRPGQGQQHNTVGSLRAALDWLRRRGL